MNKETDGNLFAIQSYLSDRDDQDESDIELTGQECQDSDTPVPHHDQEHWEGYSDDSHNN
jgi:hypothetical protein